jgi:hypothetical protein
MSSRELTGDARSLSFFFIFAGSLRRFDQLTAQVLLQPLLSLKPLQRLPVVVTSTLDPT